MKWYIHCNKGWFQNLSLFIIFSCSRVIVSSSKQWSIRPIEWFETDTCDSVLFLFIFVIISDTFVADIISCFSISSAFLESRYKNIWWYFPSLNSFRFSKISSKCLDNSFCLFCILLSIVGWGLESRMELLPSSVLSFFPNLVSLLGFLSLSGVPPVSFSLWATFDLFEAVPFSS